MEHIVEMTGTVLSIDGIDTFPEGAVREALVRCADCDHSRIEKHTGDPQLTCWVFQKFGLVVKPSHYCGYGDPKKDCQNPAKNGRAKRSRRRKGSSRPEREFIVMADGPYAENK